MSGNTSLFDKDIDLNLTSIEPDEISKHLYPILADGEVVIGAYKKGRDQLIFTDRRMVYMDQKGITGKRIEYDIMPYKLITRYMVQTPGIEIVPDAEMDVYFADGHKAHFEFKGKTDIRSISRGMSKYCM